MFPIYDISGAQLVGTETVGTKAKKWIQPPTSCGLRNIPHLFKVGRPGTGENWAEKVACELAQALGIPAARYSLAIDGTTRGVVSERFIPETENAVFFNGSAFLSGRAERAAGDTRLKRIQDVQYTIDRAYRWVHMIAKAPANVTPETGFEDGGSYFVAYCLFDAFIGNTDRHSENWGVVVRMDSQFSDFRLAPTFDHAPRSVETFLKRNDCGACRLPTATARLSDTLRVRRLHFEPKVFCCR